MDVENNPCEKINQSPTHQRLSPVGTPHQENQFNQPQFNQQNPTMESLPRMLHSQMYNMSQPQMDMFRKQYEQQRIPLAYNNQGLSDPNPFINQSHVPMPQNQIYGSIQQSPRGADDQNYMYANNNFILRRPSSQSAPDDPNKDSTVIQNSPHTHISNSQAPTPKSFSNNPRIINPNQPHQQTPTLMMSPNTMLQHSQFIQPQPQIMQVPMMSSAYIDQGQNISDNVIYQNSTLTRPPANNMSASIENNADTNIPVLIQQSSSNNQYLYQVKAEGIDQQAQNVSGQSVNHQLNMTSDQQVNMMPQVVPSLNNVNFDSLSLPNKINLIASQINQVHAALSSLTLNQNQPQTIQLYQFLNGRLGALKSIYLQLVQQQHLQQRNMMMSVHGVPPQLVNNPNAYQMYQQQMAYPNQVPSNPQIPQMVNRPSVIPNSYQVRLPQPVPGAQLIMPPGLSRFQGPRSFIASNQGLMLQQMNPRVVSTYDANRSRRGPKSQRRRRRYTSESEEEEEITSSDVDSLSQLSPSVTQFEDMELRRSTRRHTTKSYTQEYLEDSDEDVSKKDQDSVVTNPQDLVPFQPNDQNEGKLMLIERILADRVRLPDEIDDPSLIVDGMIEEFYVKFKYYSYMHCEWANANELKKRDRNSHSKIKRYKIKKKESPFLFIDDDPFNPDYVEIDRILDSKVTTDPSNPEQQVTCYLVKWCALPYDESTWEFEDCVDELSIKEYERRNTIPSIEQLQYKSKPTIYQWQKITETPVYKNGNVLRDYQLEGINWLLYEYYCGTNCILADEMGLGKTVQSIAFLIEIQKIGIRGPFLIIAPLSTIGNWYREFQNWSNFNVVVFHGAASSRNIIHRYELHYRNENNDIVKEVCKFEVLVTTYEMILAENDFLKKVRWRVAIVDEAHRLKNRKCKLLENLSNITIEYRVLLTGTPLQNTLEELLSLLNFLDPSRANALENIMQQNSGKLESNTQVQQIQIFLKPVILRRLKEDVEKNIAPKEETIIEVEMTNIQKKVYRGILERNLSFLTKGSTSSNLPNLMNIMMELRKCCNHPFLINAVEEKILSEYAAANSDIDRHSAYRRALIESSGKMVLVDKLLPKLKASGHKMLIFSQMVRVLDLIEEYLVAHNFLFERIDGSVRGNLRQAAIDRFSKPDSDRTVFLLCTKAGGLGINLTAADTVIIFDSDWNPQNDIQAQARCHRIGQNKAVKVYRLICRKTYEREMFDRASLKLGLDRAVLQDINNSNADGGKHPGGITQPQRAQLSKKEVEELLRRGAYAAVMDEDVDETAKFCSEDIDQILERRATVIQIAGEAKGSTFAKASFNANINSEQVDVDDPDFWEKWAKSANINPSAKEHDFIIEDQPRIRKKIRSLDGDDEVDIGELINEREFLRRQKQTIRTSWHKKECVKVEKYLLVYGWGKWDDVLKSASFKTNLSLNDVEQISKSILVICFHLCNKTDSSITDFVEKAIRIINLKNRQSGDLDSEDYNYRPYTKRTRSKKARSRKKTDSIKICLMQTGPDWKNVDIDTLVVDPAYKKHLVHFSSKILLRLRLLFQIEYYVLRNCKEDIISGVCVEDLVNIQLISTTQNNLNFPAWWDRLCDISLLVGTYKHGFERYNLMKADKQLSFHKHISSDVKNEETVIKRRGRKKKVIAPAIYTDDENENTLLQSESPNDLSVSQLSETSSDFPSHSDLNVYLKRLVTAYWKNRLKSLGKTESKKIELRERWTKKEESDFYKMITVYGLYRNGDDSVAWDSMRKLCDFERKTDAMLEQYLLSLLHRCRNIITNHDILPIDSAKPIEDKSDTILNYEKALKVIKRIEIFDAIRKALCFPNLKDRISSSPPDADFPSWWNIDMDVELLHAVSSYGLDPSDKRIFLDSNLKFYPVILDLHQSMFAQAQETHNQPEIQPISEMSVDIIKSLIHWPKMKSLTNRCYALSMLALKNLWVDYDSSKSNLLLSQTVIQSIATSLSTNDEHPLIDDNE